MRLTQRGKDVLACAVCIPPLLVICGILFYGVFLN